MAFLNITSATTTVVRSVPCRINRIIVNTTAAGTITIYDNTAASGTKIGTVVASVTAGTNLEYNTSCNTGLTIVTAGASDLTVIYDEDKYAS